MLNTTRPSLRMLAWPKSAFPMSSKIDEFFVALAEGVERPKPRLRLSRWWADICSKLEYRHFHQWTDVINILLNVALQEQEDAFRIFKRLAKDVRQRGEAANDAAILLPSMSKSDALVLYAFSERQKDSRYERMHELASQAFAHAHVERCLVLALDTLLKSYPYGTLSVFFRGENSDKMLTVY